MDSYEFVTAIRRVVRDDTIENLVDYLEDPPGRNVPEATKNKSDWFKKLSAKDRFFVESVIQEAVSDAIFGMLAVLDGVRAIEGPGKKGNLKLIYEGDQEVLINDPKGEDLHDIFNSP